MGVMLVDLAAAGQRRLTLSEAEQLALAALDAETKHPPSFSLAPPPIPPKNGAMFEIVWADPAPGSVHLRGLLVDIDTGEVWDPVRCVPVTTPTLETSQRRLRGQLQISPAEVNRARALAKENGCSNLSDERPKPSAFAPARLGRVWTDEKRSLYRYPITQSDLFYIGVSPVPIKIPEDAEIKFLHTRTSMYVIDDDGSIQELHDESHFVPRPQSRR
jgi:hypothetical protein